MLAWFLDASHLRMTVFFGGLALLLVLERLFPLRKTPMRRALRWPSNLGLVAIDTALLLLLPAASVGAAVYAQAHGLGLFNVLDMPPLLEGLLSWLVLDLAIYWQHRAMHEVPLLWRLHRVHHSDIEFDTTTAVRFHPLEILLSMLWKMLAVLAIGAPPVAVLALEITLNGFALFNHANFRLPGDAWLRRLIVTPDMHRVHHSVYSPETNSNYGSALSLWDRLFRSYTPQPRDGHESMRIGLIEFREEREQTLLPLLLQPIRPLKREVRP